MTPASKRRWPSRCSNTSTATIAFLRKSRVSSGPLEPFTRDPVSQHIAPYSVNRYEWMMSQHGLRLSGLETDRIQTSSVLLSLLVPFIRLATWLQFGGSQLASRQNASVALYGRKLVVIGRKA